MKEIIQNLVQKYPELQKKEIVIDIIKAHKELVKDKLFNISFLEWIDKEEIPREDGKWIKYFNSKDNYLSTQELYNYWSSLHLKTEWDIEIQEVTTKSEVFQSNDVPYSTFKIKLI